MEFGIFGAKMCGANASADVFIPSIVLATSKEFVDCPWIKLTNSPEEGVR